MRPSRVSRYSLALLATLVATSAFAQSLDVRTATVDGVTNGVWSATGLGAPAADAIVLGQPIAPYSNDWPTMVRQDGAGNIRLQNANDTAVPPTRVDLVAISGDLRAMGIPAEIGALDMDHIEREIDFAQPFAQPPVVFVTQATQYGGQPAYTFASRVDAHGATLKLREPSAFDQWHAVESVRYLAIEPGEYPLPDGRWLSVGAFDTHVGGGYSSRTIWPSVPLHAGATVIGAVQATDSETPAHTLTPVPDEQAAFWFGQHNFGDGMSYPMQAGYLIVGDRINPAAVTLLGSTYDPRTYQWTQGGASIEYLTEANNSCRTLADYGIGRLDQVELVGAGSGTTTLALFDGPRCAGQSRTLVARGAEVMDGANDWLLMEFAQNAKSFRVVHGRRAELPAPSVGEVCFAPGETLLDNGPAILQFTADGDLGLFKRNPADGGLVEAARQPLGADTLCVAAPYSIYGQPQPQLFARRAGNRVWQINTNYGGFGFGYDPYSAQPTALVLDEQCGVQLMRGELQWWNLGSDGCHTALPMPTPDPTPVPKLIFGDVDGDEDPEMVLMLTKADGSGHLMYDPLGIADFFYTVGLPPDADFLQALSQTQRDALQQQTLNVVPGGVTTIEQLLELLGRMHPASQVDAWGNPIGAGARAPSLYLTFEFEAAVDVSAVEGEAEWNGFQADASVGNFEFEMHNDADSFGYEVSASAAEASVSYDGYVTAEVTVLSAEAGMYVGDDGVAVGGGADVVAVTFRGGREDRTHIGVSAGVGVGFWAEARWGRDDLYGFTIDLPIFPVGIAIYVRGDDVKWLGERTLWLVDLGLYHGEQLGRMVWSESSTWAVGAYGDASVFVSNTYSDTRGFVEKTGSGALVGIESGVDATVAWVQGAGWTLQNTVDSIGNAIETGGQQAIAQVEQTANQAGGWVEGAANDAGNWFEGAANDVADFFGGLF